MKSFFSSNAKKLKTLVQDIILQDQNANANQSKQLLSLLTQERNRQANKGRHYSEFNMEFLEQTVEALDKVTIPYAQNQVIDYAHFTSSVNGLTTLIKKELESRKAEALTTATAVTTTERQGQAPVTPSPVEQRSEAGSAPAPATMNHEERPDPTRPRSASAASAAKMSPCPTIESCITQ